MTFLSYGAYELTSPISENNKLTTLLPDFHDQTLCKHNLFKERS